MAELVRRLTGQDHARLPARDVLAPLKMHDTSFSPP